MFVAQLEVWNWRKSGLRSWLAESFWGVFIVRDPAVHSVQRLAAVPLLITGRMNCVKWHFRDQTDFPGTGVVLPEPRTNPGMRNSGKIQQDKNILSFIFSRADKFVLVGLAQACVHCTLVALLRYFLAIYSALLLLLSRRWFSELIPDDVGGWQSEANFPSFLAFLQTKHLNGEQGKHERADEKKLTGIQHVLKSHIVSIHLRSGVYFAAFTNWTCASHQSW